MDLTDLLHTNTFLLVNFLLFWRWNRGKGRGVSGSNRVIKKRAI